MRPDPAELLTFPVKRVENRQIAGLLEAIAEVITTTNDPDTLRAVGQSLRMMGAFCRSEAYDQTGNQW